MKKYKRLTVIIIVILILLILFTPYERGSNIAEGILSSYHSLIGELTFYGDTNVSGIGISIFGFEILNINL